MFETQKIVEKPVEMQKRQVAKSMKLKRRKNARRSRSRGAETKDWRREVAGRVNTPHRVLLEQMALVVKQVTRVTRRQKK